MLTQLWAALHKRETGVAGEARALTYLQAQGLSLVARNFRSRFGEIDLIMVDGATLVFVEVRVRRHTKFGSAAESVTVAKQRRLICTAQSFLQQHPAWQKHNCRFDIVGLNAAQMAAPDPGAKNTEQAAQWLRAAFTL